MLTKVKRLLKKNSLFKFIIGASYIDSGSIENLLKIYIQARADIIDLPADPSIVLLANQIKRKFVKNSSFPILMISIGVNNDIHFVKLIKNDNLCINCKLCEFVCPNNVFYNNTLIYSRCVGCKKCIDICKYKALELKTYNTDINKIVECIHNGAKAIEIHCGQGNINNILKVWNEVNQLKKHFKLISFSLIGNSNEIITLIGEIQKFINDEVLWQIDGQPISGDYGINSSFKSIELIKEVRRVYPDIFIQIAGGANDYTYLLSKIENININGIGIGSFARKYIKVDYTKPLYPSKLKYAIKKAKELINFKIL